MYLNWMWNVLGQVNIFNGCGWVRLKLNLFILGNCRLLFFHLFCFCCCCWWCFSLLLPFVFHSLAPTCTQIHFFGLTNSWCALICSLRTNEFSLFQTFSIWCSFAENVPEIWPLIVIVNSCAECRFTTNSHWYFGCLYIDYIGYVQVLRIYDSIKFIRTCILCRQNTNGILKCLWI